MHETRLKVIIFEDNDELLQSLTYLVKSLGHEALGFQDPTFCPLYVDPTCTCSVDQPCADVLITDKVMPNMTGLEFIRNQALKGCKGVNKHKAVMSGFWTRAEMDEAQQLGCKLFTKPFNYREVRDWLRECESEIGQHREKLKAGIG